MPSPDRTSRECSLRGEEDADRAFLAELFTAGRAAELAPLPLSEDEKRAFLRAQFEAQDAHYRAHYPEAQRRIVEVSGDRAGRLYLCRWRGEYGIVDIALLPGYRGLGIGSDVLLGVMADARRARATVSVHVAKSNRARRLYRRLAFRPVSEGGVYDRLEWRDLDNHKQQGDIHAR